MSFKITMGTPEATDLQNAIQQELAKFEYAPGDDPVMAEYITVMLANNKTSDQITEELVDLVGDNYEPSFTTWLFARAAGGAAPPTVKAEEPVEQQTTEAEGSRPSDRAPPPHLFARAVAASSSNPQASSSSGQKRSASHLETSEGGREVAEPLSKRRTDGGVGGVPTGPRAGVNPGGKNLLDRMGGAQANEARAGQDAFQAKIDTLTQNQAQMGASLGMNNPAFGRNQQQGGRHNGQGMHMNGGFGGPMGMGGMGGMGMNMGMGMGVQEMMLAQMAQMQFMQQQMQQFAQQGGLLPQQPQQQVPFSGGPQRTNGAGNRPNHHNQAPRAGAPGGRASPKPYVAPLAKPTDPTLCKFSLGCTNPQCPYSHPSPAATPESALVLSIEPCELQRKCKDPDCVKSHVSPASVAGHTATPLPCKYQNCNNPSCPFLHTDDQGNPIPPPALTNPSLAVPHTKKDPKFASAPASKPWKTGAGLGGPKPYTKSKPHPAAIVPSTGMNKSVKFNPEAKEFVPKSTTPATHISDRLVSQTEGASDAEKIIPSPSPAPTSEAPPAAVSGFVQAAAASAPAAAAEEKKE